MQVRSPVKAISGRGRIDIVPAAEEQEIATTEHWRGVMKRARIDHGMTQKQLGDRVNQSQTNISDIESGEVGSSSAILAICRVLDIPPPYLMLEDVVEQRWLDVGRVLRRQNPAKFDRWLAHLMAEVADEPGSPDDSGSGEPPEH